MDDKTRRKNCNLIGPAALTTAVSRDEFGTAVLDYLSETARIGNFCVFFFPDLRYAKGVQSLCSGRIGDYWLRRNGDMIINDPKLIDPVLDAIRAAPEVGVRIERWHPSPNDAVLQLYEQFDVLERVSVTSRSSQFGYKSFFLRDKADGWISDKEYDGLCEILPFVHELIGLRHRITGAENFQLTAAHYVSGLRARQVFGFLKLSKREAEVCDCVVTGMTIAGTALELGISEATVKTLRQRAYRKLGVNSVTQLMALILHDSKGVK